MNRLIKARKNGKFQQIVTPGTMRFLDFATLHLEKGDRHSLSTGGREYVIDIFSGAVTLTVGTVGRSKEIYRQIGKRADVFSGPPVMSYLPPNSQVEIKAESAVEMGIFSAPASSQAAAALLEGATVVTKQVGRDNWLRTVYSALGENVPAERLLAGETLNPPGNWSSFPPHKHDRSNPPQEAVLEEIYYFRLKPAQGFGFIWTYTAADDPEGFSSVFVVEDGDTVLLPKGYHPVVAAPGYELHYTWVLAGEERRYGAWADDPRHAWVRGQ
ncbi:MAG: 5-deoxy-glucuronate isomerase [Terriglobia bacterium]|jgi:5-deoxy-glucuronate isomerase